MKNTGFPANNTPLQRISLPFKCGVILILVTSNAIYAGGVSGIISRNISNDISRELRDRVLKRNQELMNEEKQEAQATTNKENKKIKAALENQPTLVEPE